MTTSWIDKIFARRAGWVVLFAVLLSVLFVACGGTDTGRAPTPVDPTPAATIPATVNPTPAITTPLETPTPEHDPRKDDLGDRESLREAQAQLDKYRALWTSTGATDYSFELAPRAMFQYELREPVRIEVVNRVKSTVKYVESGITPKHDSIERYVTIDGLFDTIQDAIDRKAYSIFVSYDRNFGYPTNAGFDYSYFTVDEEYGFAVSGFTPGPTDTPAPSVAATATQGPVDTPTATPEPADTPATATKPVPTATPARNPIATRVPTATPEPTNTPVPPGPASPTPVPAAAPTATPEPTATPKPTPTPEPPVTIVDEADLAFDFTLPNAHGGQVSLDDYQGNKNVVLVFYRAFW